MRIILTICITCICIVGTSQTKKIPTINDALQKYSFLEEEIVHKTDTITYYLKNYKNDKVKPDKLVVFIQGTDPNPIFSYKIKNDKYVIYRWFNNDYKTLDSTYTFAIVPKPGLSGIINEEKNSIPQSYHIKNHREYRVNQIHFSIEHIIKKHLKKPNKIIVYGHSEGAVIAASLVQKNKNITHLGFWSGNVLNNFYEFSLFERIAALKKQQSDSIAHTNIMNIIDWYKKVINKPNSTAIDDWGFTNKRWSSYQNPPIQDLLKIDIPIYTVFGTQDESTPIETAYLIPIQFMQLKKNNLTFDICIGCDHTYTEKNNDKITKHWNRIFKEFIAWTK
ncbi:hypothetical protein [Aquimarina algiphila]|uniref:hypothetical protein n=1 Tax=Aquimarina algiphila TaxID=2047982 RepID=UPI00232C6EFC|nr:hypothetical protein [Aquimarina algiphila]